MKTRIQAIAVLVAVLLLGCLIGVTGSWLRYGKYMETRAAERRGGPTFPPRYQDQRLPDQRLPEQRLPELLRMTPEQKILFEDIMRESRQELDAMSREQQLKINTVVAGTNEKIRSILNDEQKIKLETSLNDVNGRRKRGVRGAGSPDPSPKGGRGHNGR